MNAPRRVLVNRAPVLTLWAAIVAERQGHAWGTALTLGKAVAGLNAQSKGQRLGIYEKPEPGTANARKPEGTTPDAVHLLGRAIPIAKTPKGVRALVNDRPEPPEAVERYLDQKFGEDRAAAEEAMRELARAYGPEELAHVGFALYEEFRPAIPEGVRGWGAKGEMDLGTIRRMARRS